MGQMALLDKVVIENKTYEWIYRYGANPGRPWGGIVPPSPVLAPGSVLRSRPCVALSSAQVRLVHFLSRCRGNLPVLNASLTPGVGRRWDQSRNRQHSRSDERQRPVVWFEAHT